MSRKEVFVVKRDGTQEPLDINKIHKVIGWACEGVEGVSVSEIESQAKVKFFQGIKTSDVHESIVAAAHELISEESPHYDIVAGRLSMYDIRKKVYGGFTPHRLFDIITRNVKEGWYDKDLVSLYTEEEWDIIESFIVHERDFDIRIVGAREWRNKYLVKNRYTGEFKESPQIAYVLIAAILMKKYVDEYGIGIVKEYYDVLSKGESTKPSPLISGVRTNTRQFSSCTLIETGDSLSSISSTADACMKYAARKAGLGIGVFNLRAEKSPVRNGEVTTTGPIPFTQFLQGAVLSCSQGNLRKGSATFYHHIWHTDVEKLLVLKNNKGTEETRVRHSDHAFNLNGYLLKRLVKGGDFYLFSPENVPDLHKAFFDNPELFAHLYEKYGKDESIRKTVVRGEDIRDLLIRERIGTSRVYIHFVDNANSQGSFKPEFAPIKMSNLCLEIELPTKPLEKFDDPEGLISLCTLSAINWGDIKKPTDMETRCRLTVMALDSLLDYQEYPLQAAKNSTDWFRPLGIGINDFAHFLARRNLKYGKSSAAVVDEYMEHMAFYLTKTSVELAKKYGACGKVKDTKYGDGILPYDSRKVAVDEIVSSQTRLDWESLRSDMKQYGIRNATLMACMPSETSSRVQNLTNGIEPVRSLITTKDGLSLVVPEFKKLKNKYEISWDVDVSDYLMTMAVIQKWVDQAISVNTSYDPAKFKDGVIPGSMILQHIIQHYKYGGKTLYYNNGVKHEIVEKDEEKEQTPVDETEEMCESCVL